jgi:Tfp pilus assembly protein PilZ
MIPSQSLEHRRANLKWPVRFSAGNGPIEGVTLTVSSKGLFICCLHPLRIHEVCELVLDVPDTKAPVHAVGQVVWSNVYGPDDNVSPRGMGVRFTRISGKDREAISRYVLTSLKLKDVQPDKSTIEISLNSPAASTSVH